MKSYALIATTLLSATLLTACSDEPEDVVAEAQEAKQEIQQEVEKKEVTLKKAYADVRAKTKAALKEGEEAVAALEALKESQEDLEAALAEMDEVMDSQADQEALASAIAAKQLREAAAKLEAKSKPEADEE